MEQSFPSPVWYFVRAHAVLALTLTTAPVPALRAESAGGKLGIDNFGKMDANYYRGAQPDEAGFTALGNLGVKTVVDLRDDPDPRERAWVQGAGMRYVNLPLSTTRPASEADTERFLKLVGDPANWPVFVHCQGGRHRTGEMTAIYRITHDAWTADRAYGEMKQFKYYAFPFHGPLRDHVFRYYESYRRSAEAASSSNAGTAGAAASVVSGARTN